MKVDERRDIPGERKFSASALYYFYTHLVWRDYSARPDQFVVVFVALQRSSGKTENLPNTQTHTQVRKGVSEEKKKRALQKIQSRPLCLRHRFGQQLLLPPPFLLTLATRVNKSTNRDLFTCYFCLLDKRRSAVWFNLPYLVYSSFA